MRGCARPNSPASPGDLPCPSRVLAHSPEASVVAAQHGKASTANRQLPEKQHSHLIFYRQLCQQEGIVSDCPSPKRGLVTVVSFLS